MLVEEGEGIQNPEWDRRDDDDEKKKQEFHPAASQSAPPASQRQPQPQPTQHQPTASQLAGLTDSWRNPRTKVASLLSYHPKLSKAFLRKRKGSKDVIKNKHERFVDIHVSRSQFAHSCSYYIAVQPFSSRYIIKPTF